MPVSRGGLATGIARTPSSAAGDSLGGGGAAPIPTTPAVLAHVRASGRRHGQLRPPLAFNGAPAAGAAAAAEEEDDAVGTDADADADTDDDASDTAAPHVRGCVVHGRRHGGGASPFLFRRCETGAGVAAGDAPDEPAAGAGPAAGVR